MKKLSRPLRDFSFYCYWSIVLMALLYLPMPYFNYNGKLFTDGSAVIGTANRGLRYGDGLFETIKCISGQLLLADEHFARLWKGMGVLQFEIPKHFTPDKLEEAIIALAKKNGHEAAARVRLTVTRGDGGLYDAINHFPNYSIETWPLANVDTKITGLNSNGLVLGIYTAVKKSCDILSNLKHNNYLPYVMAALFAKKQKWNDAIVLNTEGRIADTTIANIFFIKDEQVFTPALDEGCVAGVMRGAVIKQLAVSSWQLAERPITVEEIMQADEVFLTNSIYDVRWVQRIGDKEYGNTITQKIYAAVLPTIC